MKSKVYDSAASALDGLLFDGMTIAAGGFGLCGIPELLIAAIRDAGTKDLTVASNNAGVDDFGLGVLLQTRQVRKMISSYVGENAEFMRQYLSGELELEFNPQGTLAERMRAGGAGIPGFYTRTGVGTVIAEGKEEKDFDGETYILERGIVADLAIVKAWKGDAQGNLVYRKTARNFNPNAATCGRVCVAEVEEIVPLGALDPDGIHTPGIFVHRIIQGDARKAHRTAHHPRRLTGGDRSCPGTATRWPPARRRNSRTGCTSTSASAFRRWCRTTSPTASTSRCSRRTACSAWARSRPRTTIDADLINAGKQTITELDRTSYFSSADSFGMIRGGKIDMAILGAMEVAENGDLANWMIPGKLVKGMGGAMDLVAGVKRVVVVMDHASKHGEPKLLHECTLPLTGKAVVDRIITNLGVFDVVEGGLTIVELADGVSEADIRAATEATLV